MQSDLSKQNHTRTVQYDVAHLVLLHLIESDVKTQQPHPVLYQDGSRKTLQGLVMFMISNNLKSQTMLSLFEKPRKRKIFSTIHINHLQFYCLNSIYFSFFLSN